MDELTPEERDVVARARAAWIMGDAEAAGRILDEYVAHRPERREVLLAHRDAPVGPIPPTPPAPPTELASSGRDAIPMRSGQIAARAFATAGISLVLGAGLCIYALQGFMAMPSRPPLPGQGAAGVLTIVAAIVFVLSLGVGVIAGIASLFRKR